MDSSNLIKAAQKIYDKLPEEPERFTWEFRQRDLMRMVIEQGGDLDRLLHWPIVREALHAGFTKQTRGEMGLIPKDLRHLSKDPDFLDVPKQLSEYGASGTYIKQLLVATLLENHMHKKFSAIDSVYEVGGGYGAMAVVLSRLGFVGEHTVLDSPALHLIREWYLDKAGVLTKSHAYPRKKNVDVFLAVHSIDEMPRSERAKVLKRVKANSYAFSVHQHWLDEHVSDWLLDWLSKNGCTYTVVTEGVTPGQAIILAERV